MSEFVYLKSRNWFIGVEPGTTHVYADRDVPNGWERIELTKLDNGMYVCRFTDANVMLSLQPDGRFETRPAGTFGNYEQIAGGIIEKGPMTGTRILGPFLVQHA